MERSLALRAQDVLEHQAVQAQDGGRALDVAQRPREIVAREFGPWLTAQSAAQFLDYPAGRKGVNAFREWARRACVPTAHRGRRVLYSREDLLEIIGAKHRRRRLRSVS